MRKRVVMSEDAKRALKVLAVTFLPPILLLLYVLIFYK